MRTKFYKLAIVGTLSTFLFAMHANAEMFDSSHLKLKTDTLEMKADPNVLIKYEYPQIVDATKTEAITKFNQKIQGLMQSEKEEFIGDAQKNNTKNLPKSMIENSSYITYDATYLTAVNHHVLSVHLVKEKMLAGQAHPAHEQYSLNFDLDKATSIHFSELFKNESAAINYIKQYAFEKLSKTVPDQKMLREGLDKIHQFEYWNISPKGLIVHFDELTITPYFYGQQKVTVPYQNLKEYVASDSIIFSCVNQEKSCRIQKA